MKLLFALILLAGSTLTSLAQASITCEATTSNQRPAVYVTQTAGDGTIVKRVVAEFETHMYRNHGLAYCKVLLDGIQIRLADPVYVIEFIENNRRIRGGFLGTKGRFQRFIDAESAETMYIGQEVRNLYPDNSFISP